MDQSYGDASDALEASLFGGEPASVLQASDRLTAPNPADLTEPIETATA
jgi:hypothetical protein